MYTDPAQNVITAAIGSTVDDLDRDLSDVDELYRDLSGVNYLDRDLSDGDDLEMI